MKKNIFVFIILFVLIGVGVIGYFIYDDYKIKEDNTKITLLKNNIEVYEEYKLSDLISVDGTLDKDIIIKEDELKSLEYEVFYHYKNKPRKAKIKLEVVDTTKPIAILRDSLTINIGDNPIDKIISGDNYDSTPLREIVGDYNVNVQGTYSVTYKVTDKNNNVLEIPFTLKVIPKSNTVYSNTITYYSDIINNYKSDNTKFGIDVSKWQGNINFQKIKDKIDFMYIRVGTQQGFNMDSVQDSYFIQNITKANENNIPVGIYYYSYATTKEEAKTQALWVIEQLKNYKVDMPVAFDWESFSKFNSLNLSIHEFNEIAEEFINTLEENGYEASLYGSKNYLEKIWNTKNKKIWLANYVDKTTYEGDYYLWQMCNDGKIDGINGYVDIDILYIK